MKFVPALALAVLPGLASAEMHDQINSGILVDDLVHCAEFVDVDPELHIFNVVDAGGATLTSLGMAFPEVDCWFDEEIALTWESSAAQLTLGACYVADQIRPTVFAIVAYPELPGTVSVWEQGVAEPAVFHACAAPG